MITKKYKVPVELHYLCDECRTEVEPTGQILTSNPAKFVHKCPKCNKEIWLDHSYPCIVYEDKTIASDIMGSNLNLFNL
jgi:DNA-directed RNA polymerase subunit RPC12/RpoP